MGIFNEPPGRQWISALAVLAFCLLLPGSAHSYGIDAHRALVDLALEPTEQLAASVPATDTPALVAFREHLFHLASTVDDSDIRTQFLERWPSPEDFDAQAFKQLTGLCIEAEVHGIDVGGVSLRGDKLLAEASIWPDTDHRNRKRVEMGSDGQPLLDSWNRTIPKDPATLDMGARTGLSSQAHAHYQLWPGEHTEDAAVLRSEPWRFSRPGNAHSFGADFAQSYTDLAGIAANWQHPAARWLELTWTGAAFHHIQDTANTLHTLQVGSFDYFVMATRHQVLGDLWTLGGLLGPRRSLRTIGIRLLRDHHVFAEELWARRVRNELARMNERDANSEANGFLSSIRLDDPAFLSYLEKASREGASRASHADFARRITLALAVVGGPEGAQVYDQAWQLANSELKGARGPHSEASSNEAGPQPSIESQPERFLRPQPWSVEYTELVGEFYELQLKGMRRAGTAMRLWRRLHRQVSREELGDRRVMARWITERLAEDRARSERRGRWTPSPPMELGLDLRVPGIVLLALGLLLWALRALFRSKRAQPEGMGGAEPR